MILRKLLNIIEVNTKLVIDESKTKLWQVNGNKTIIKDKSLQEISHKATEKYENYEVIGIEVLDNTLHIAIFNKEINMKDSEFWKIADKYEKMDHRGKLYVPMKNVRSVSTFILLANDCKKSESLEDFNLFNFKRKEKALQIFNEVCEMIGED